jgi:hypothetical protein
MTFGVTSPRGARLTPIQVERIRRVVTSDYSIQGSYFGDCMDSPSLLSLRLLSLGDGADAPTCSERKQRSARKGYIPGKSDSRAHEPTLQCDANHITNACPRLLSGNIVDTRQLCNRLLGLKSRTKKPHCLNCVSDDNDCWPFSGASP